MSNRYKNLEKKISEFQKEDNINNLTKQTLFDHLNNVAMYSNNNTQSARVNADCNTIENQLGKQHVTKLFKNLQEAEAEELDINSAAKEVAEMLKNYRSKKVPAPLHTSVKDDRTENFDGDGDDSEEDDIENDADDDSEEGDDCDDDDELDKDYQVNHCYDYDDKLDYDTKHSIAQIGKAVIMAIIIVLIVIFTYKTRDYFKVVTLKVMTRWYCAIK
jgi:hypothetical protein